MMFLSLSRFLIFCFVLLLSETCHLTNGDIWSIYSGSKYVPTPTFRLLFTRSFSRSCHFILSWASIKFDQTQVCQTIFLLFFPLALNISSSFFGQLFV